MFNKYSPPLFLTKAAEGDNHGPKTSNNLHATAPYGGSEMAERSRPSTENFSGHFLGCGKGVGQERVESTKCRGPFGILATQGPFQAQIVSDVIGEKTV